MHSGGSMNIETIAVLGAGTMGHGIARLGAEASLNVVLCDISGPVLERAMKMIEAGMVIEGKTVEQCRVITGRIRGMTSIRDAVRSAGLVIECLPEDLELKKKVFREIDGICSPEVILATNTSGLSPTEIAKDLAYPERVVVTHFWNPPQLIPLVEIVPGERTSLECGRCCGGLGKVPGKRARPAKKGVSGFYRQQASAGPSERGALHCRTGVCGYRGSRQVYNIRSREAPACHRSIPERRYGWARHIPYYILLSFPGPRQCARSLHD